MALRTSTYQSVLHGVSYMVGLEPNPDILSATTLTNTMAASINEYINTAVKVAWWHYVWPETVVVEQRTPASQVIEFTPTGTDTEIAEVICVTQEEPYVTKNLTDVVFNRRSDDVVLTEGSPTSAVWVTFQKPEPKFTSILWDDSTTYVENDLVFFGTELTNGDGEVYKASSTPPSIGDDPSEDTTDWVKVEFPAIFDSAVKEGARALFLAEENQHTSTKTFYAVMESHLDQMIEKVAGHAGQLSLYEVGA